MTKTEAQKLVGFVVQSDDSEIFGILEYVTACSCACSAAPSPTCSRRAR